MPKLAANVSWLFTEVTRRDRFAAAAGCGFTAVECLFPYGDPSGTLADLLADAGLTLELFNLPPGDWANGERGIASLPGREAEFEAGLDLARRYAEQCGTPRLHVMAGILPTGADPAQARDCYMNNLRRAARSLAQDGRTLLVEPINTRDMPGYLLSTLEQALDVLESLGEPNLRIQADLYHLQIMGGDLMRRVTAALPRIGHVQIAGVPDRSEPDQGELRYEALFGMLDEQGYEGWIGCEYRPRGQTEDGLDWAAKWLRPEELRAAKSRATGGIA